MGFYSPPLGGRSLFTPYFKYLPVFQPTLQVVVNLHRTYTYWRSRVEQVACLQGEELRDVADELVNRVQHVAGISLLDGLSVDVQMEP